MFLVPSAYTGAPRPPGSASLPGPIPEAVKRLHSQHLPHLTEASVLGLRLFEGSFFPSRVSGCFCSSGVCVTSCVCTRMCVCVVRDLGPLQPGWVFEVQQNFTFQKSPGSL